MEDGFVSGSKKDIVGCLFLENDLKRETRQDVEFGLLEEPDEHVSSS